MKKSMNGTESEPSEIIDEDVTKSRKFERAYGLFKSDIIGIHNILKDKELFIMFMISFIWYFALLYLVIFVFI
jgi:hypothetical protein